jgi:tetratricopeptide (TPR) repeat protein
VSDPLSFAEHLLSRARLMLRVGRPAEARRLSRNVLRQPNPSHRLRADAFCLLAEIELEAGRFRRARRHLAAAIRLRRHADELYVAYSRAVDADPNADPRLAVKAMRRGVAIDPFEPRSWAALGTAAHNAGDDVLARRAFRRAARLRPDDFDTLSEIVDGFLHLDLEVDARAVVTAARFRLPRHTELIALTDRVSFTMAQRRQRQSKVQDGAAAILPLPKRPMQTADTELPTVVLRVDGGHNPRPHLLRMFGRQSGPRKAN